MLRKTYLSAISVAILMVCISCGDGGSSALQSSANSTGQPLTTNKPNLALDITPSENAKAFTVVVGPPFVMQDGSTPIYDNLYINLTSSAQQGKLPVARILLAIENPGTPTQSINNVFRIGDSFNLTDPKNGQAIAFLNKLAKYNATSNSPIEVYAFPDVEISSDWESWVYPTSAPNTPSCLASNSEKDPSKRAMLHSICWVSLVNQLIGGSKPIIAGVAYDNQSNYLANAHKQDVPAFSPTGWTYSQTHGDVVNGVSLNLGWVSAGGISTGSTDIVDLNLIEVYDLYSNKGPYYDSVVAATVTSTSPPFLPTPSNPTCSGVMCAFELGIAPCPKGTAGQCTAPFSPGYQYEYVNGPLTVGAVGSNIYQCAISDTASKLVANGCNAAYSSNIDLKATADIRLLQSLNYIKLNLSPLPTPMQAPLSPIYGNHGDLSGKVVYLFSTQYAGPVQSYLYKDKITGLVTSSKSLCTDSSNINNLCTCIASQFDPYASCGDENSFGSWGNNLPDFKNFVMGPSGFLSSQGANNCPGTSCSAGIYMYDFIPQAWYR